MTVSRLPFVGRADPNRVRDACGFVVRTQTNSIPSQPHDALKHNAERDEA